MASMKILNKRSRETVSGGGAKVPSPSQLEYGEIAINYKTGKETISIKNDSNEIVSFTPAVVHHIYQHNIAIYGDSTTNIYLTIITNFSTAFDVPSFISWINNLSSFTGAGIECAGTVRTNSSGIAIGRAASRIVPGATNASVGVVYHATGDAGVDGPIEYSNGSGNNDFHSISDTVIQVL